MTDHSLLKMNGRNEEYLAGFADWLSERNLSEGTVSMHVHNASLYVNDYLLQRYQVDARDGHLYADDYFGYFYIRKVSRSSAGGMKRMAASLRKFYEYMADAGHIDARNLSEFRILLREEMPAWVKRCERYHDPSYDFQPDEWLLQ